MFSTILVPVDLDRPPASRPAMATALRIARVWRGRVTAMTVASLFGEEAGRAEARLADWLSGVAAEVGMPGEAPFPVEPHVVQGGDIRARIVDVALAGVDPVTDAMDIAATVCTYAASLNGEITDARPCGRLRHCLIGKIPAA